jgi:predicted flap endonuclease-1-like 5' DNA nuclease
MREKLGRKEHMMADYKIEEIEGIGKVYGPKLQSIGIKTVADLLERGKSPKGRKELAEAAGIDGTLILKWANMADLFRIKGIGPEYSELLEKAGVDTIKELRHRVPEHLHAKLTEINTKVGQPLVRVLPGLGAVQDWIEQAKSLEPMITY